MNFPTFQARNKPADGTIVSQKLQAGQRTPTHGPKNAQSKTTGKPVPKSTAQKGQPIKQAPAKAAAAAAATTKTKKPKKGGKHHQHDLIVTIDLVSYRCFRTIKFSVLEKIIKYNYCKS